MKKETATRKTYSLYPKIIAAIEKYADERGISCSAVISLAVTEMLDKSYFEESNKSD